MYCIPSIKEAREKKMLRKSFTGSLFLFKKKSVSTDLHSSILVVQRSAVYDVHKRKT